MLAGRFAAITVKIPYPRPRKLSDPHSDFTPKLLAELLATPDNQLQWNHFQNLLGPFLPAGTYRESVYFLPLAFNYLRRSDDALEFTTSVTWFVSEYADDLAADGLLDECRTEITSCLLHWMRDFTVLHFDRDACAAKGWGLWYFDYVQRSQDICETLCDLDRFARHADLADAFISQLVSSDEPVSVGWFFELARGQDDVYHPPTRESFHRHFSDVALLTHKQAIAEEHLAPVTASPTYWNDVFTKLGLKVYIANERF